MAIGQLQGNGLNLTRGHADTTAVITSPTFTDALRLTHRTLWEEPGRALTMAREIEHQAAEHDASLTAAARALQGRSLIMFGEIEEALQLAARPAPPTEQTPYTPIAEILQATFRAQLALFIGSYREAITHATQAITTADATNDDELRLAARAGTCIVLGSLQAPSLERNTRERVAIAARLNDQWDLAVAHNDLASVLLLHNDLPGATHEVEAAFTAAEQIAGPDTTARAVLTMTRAELDHRHGNLADAITQAAAASHLLESIGYLNPYLTAAGTQIAVAALADANQTLAAVTTAKRGLTRLGNHLPLSRSAILADLADALQREGRTDDAYTTLRESIRLERDGRRQLSQLQDDLHDALQHRHHAQTLKDEAERDYLTGLGNRRHLSRLNLTDTTTVGVALIDLDFFKDVNDRFGHAAGDAVLARVAALLTQHARTTDTVVRLGGDEFVLVAPGLNRDDAERCATRIRRSIAHEPWQHIAPGIRVTASVGVATGHPNDIDQLIRTADHDMYTAKRSRPTPPEQTPAT